MSRSKVRLAVLCAVGVLLAGTVSAQNLCTSTSNTTVVYNPSKIVAQLPDFNATIQTTAGTTTPLWDAIRVGVFSNGVDPSTGQPVSTFDVPRASWTLIAGTPDCYIGQPAQLLTLPLPTLQFVVAKKVRTLAEPMETVWGAPSNPFASLPALSAPAVIRLTK
jgi:hypothetical protein